jgi:hypothetical protein
MIKMIVMALGLDVLFRAHSRQMSAIPLKNTDRSGEKTRDFL